MKLRTISTMAAILLLAGCSGESTDEQSVSGTDESIEVTTSQTPVFQATQVAPVVAPNNGEAVHDPGLNVDIQFQGTGYETTGGSIIYVAVRNLNDVALPVDAIAQPTLKIKDYNGALIDVAPLQSDDNIPLDLPLGSQATTNLQYTFDTSNYSLWSAEFRIGNVVFDGNLNNR